MFAYMCICKNISRYTVMDKKVIDTLEYENGGVYHGECVNNVRQGKGVYTQNGVSISGVWTNNHLNGDGIMDCVAFRYEGGFKNSMRHGIGKEVLKDGTIYQGEFAFGKRHGNIKIYLTNGATVDCVFDKGVGVGDGVMTMSDGERVPVYFKDGNLFFK